jgi:pyridoxal phosphate enzyme (YggS family)
MSDIINNLNIVRQQISNFAEKYQRNSNDINLLAVSKTKPISDILVAIETGQKDFGENYLQDAIPKINALEKYKLTWHFIGALQSNKTKIIAENFSWVHSVDKFKYAQRLSKQRPNNMSALNICIQVNLSNEQQKAGINLDNLADLIIKINELPQIKLRGLMTLPAFSQDFIQQRQAFKNLHKVFSSFKHNNNFLDFDTLSMGMSGDLEAAIAEGSTMVRIGTAIFGKRKNKC